jgi:alanine racemase
VDEAAVQAALRRAARPVWGEIDVDALVHNVKELRRWLRPGLGLGGSIKANAYGHGASQVGPILADEGLEFLMTASFSDALALRASRSDLKIVMLAACLPEAIPDLLRASLTPTIHTLTGAEAVSRYADRPTSVHVKVDSGLGRIGVDVEDAVRFVQQVTQLPNVVVDGIYTHLPFSDARGEAWARQRLERFVDAVASIRSSGLELPFAQAASSPGVETGLDAPELTAVCIGSLLYGLPMVAEPLHDPAALRRALFSIRAQLIQVSRHQHDRTAGSGGTRTLSAGAVTGVVPIGILDGYRSPRAAGRLAMLVRGARVSVLGVTLGHTTVDLSRVPDASVGDEVVILGAQGDDEVTLDELADASGATLLEAIVGFDRRIEYDYVHAGATGRPPRGFTGQSPARY